MSGEDNGLALWNLICLINKDRTLCLERGNNVNVVHDLLANINRCAIESQGFFNGDDGAIYPCAISARRCQ
jgi:hypothetical protein